MTDITHIRWADPHRREGGSIDSSAFLTAFIATPFVIGGTSLAAGFLFSAVAASLGTFIAFGVLSVVICGAPAYLFLGGPAFFTYLNRTARRQSYLPLKLVAVGFLANLGSPFLYGLAALLLGGDVAKWALLAFGIGATAGCLNSLVFGWIYSSIET
ncbi:MAG: hypothetical protein AAFQ88_08810 [Pseudomonadota bacterium]